MNMYEEGPEKEKQKYLRMSVSKEQCQQLSAVLKGLSEYLPKDEAKVAKDLSTTFARAAPSGGGWGKPGLKPWKGTHWVGLEFHDPVEIELIRGAEEILWGGSR